MRYPTTFDETARYYVFLTAAWIANVDGAEADSELDALCQLRKALDIGPAMARHLHHLARSAAAFTPPTMEAA